MLAKLFDDLDNTYFEFGPTNINNGYLDLAKIEIKQTEIDTIHSLENFMYNLLLLTETVIVAHPVLF
jgi:hypothetical protein